VLLLLLCLLLLGPLLIFARSSRLANASCYKYSAAFPRRLHWCHLLLSRQGTSGQGAHDDVNGSDDDYN
jgi:hypothetical protein